jgi:hypothetical protein
MLKPPPVDTFEVISQQLRIVRSESLENDPAATDPWPRPVREKVTGLILRLLRLFNDLGLDRTRSLLEQVEDALFRNLGHKMAICKVGYGGGPLENLPKPDQAARYSALCDDLQQVLHAARMELPEDAVLDRKAEAFKKVSPEAMKAYVAQRLGIAPKTLQNKVVKAMMGWKPGDKVKAADRGLGLPWVVVNDMAGEWLVSSIEDFEKWLTTQAGQQWKR